MRTYVPTAEDRQSLGSLLADDGSDVAFLRHDDVTWYARGLAHPHEPRSPVVDLVQGLWERDPLNARSIVRRRIFTSYAPSAMERDLVKVAAKRIFGPVRASDTSGGPLRREEVGAFAQQASRSSSSCERGPSGAGAGLEFGWFESWRGRSLSPLTMGPARAPPRNRRRSTRSVVSERPSGRVPPSES